MSETLANSVVVTTNYDDFADDFYRYFILPKSTIKEGLFLV
jgi:hypothetical protein